MDLVLYCPGDAPGSPAYLPRQKAEELVQKDMDYCRVMERATGVTYQLPHVNGSCKTCVKLFGGFHETRANG